MAWMKRQSEKGMNQIKLSLFNLMTPSMHTTLINLSKTVVRPEKRRKGGRKGTINPRPVVRKDPRNMAVFMKRGTSGRQSSRIPIT
jgi:hypothetical protein